MEYHQIENQPQERRRELGCCGCMEKWFLWSVNCILFVVAVAEIGAGIYVMSSNSTTWTGSDLPKFAIVMGTIVGFIAFLGCCGAARENKCMLWTYAFVLFWIILAQTSGLTVCAIGSSYTEEFLSEAWDNLSEQDRTNIEENYKCCSFNGNSTDAIPSDKAEYATCIAAHSEWVETCWDKVHGDVESNFRSISIAVAIVLGAQILFLFMTMALISGITATTAYRRVSFVFGGPKVGV